MFLILASFVMGFIGLNVGGIMGTEFVAYMLGIAGFLSPSLFLLEQIYREIKKKPAN